MKVRYLVWPLAILGGLLLARGIQILYLRSLPAERLMRTLSHLTDVRKQEGYQGKQAFVISLPEGSQIILLGNVLGNYESLRQILDELTRSSVLSLKGTLKKDHFLIMNGPFLGPTSTNGQVLETLAQLIEQNSQMVWYLRGPQDDLGKLQDLSLFSKGMSFLQARTVGAFYGTLPRALYLLAENLNELPVRIGPYGADSSQFDRIACYPVNNGPIQSVCHLNDLCYYSEGTLAGIIDSDDQKIDWATMKGLQHADSSWHLISSPSLEYTLRYGYSTSAYAVITMGKDLASSTLTYFYAPQGTKHFVQGESFPLKRGKEKETQVK